MNVSQSTLTIKLLIIVFIVSFTNASFVLTVRDDDEQCLVIHAPPQSVVKGNFDVLDDNLTPDPVRVKLLNFGNDEEEEEEEMEVLYESQHGSSEDLFHVRTRHGGRFYVCIQNGMDINNEDGMERNVGLDIRVTTLPKTASEDSSSAQELLMQSDALSEKLWDLQNHFDYMRNREASHRETTEETFTQVVRWSVIELVTLVGIAIAQVVVLRKFFEQKRFI